VPSSIAPKTHQGLESCKLIKYYVENYKCLKEVAIILKQFLSKMDLNSPYHGKFYKFINNYFRWCVFLFYGAPSSGIYEQMEFENECNDNAKQAAYGLP